jgi:hypothetical protein
MLKSGFAWLMYDTILTSARRQCQAFDLRADLVRTRCDQVFDRKMPYDKTKKYVLMETNEGDTPRIVVSAFSQSWTDPRRGTLSHGS